MSKSTMEIIGRFRKELHEDFLELSRKQDTNDKEITYLGVNHSRIQQELYNAVQLFSEEGESHEEKP